MSSEKVMRISKALSTSTPAPPGDHRKRRRNRTTQSCLNCHASKRMCDRRRPACQRCTTLGLSGLCVYEVDDPSQRNTFQDEKVLLRNRVAELEGVIREMKNKPHPRWAQKPTNSRVPDSQSSDDDCALPLITTDSHPSEDNGNIPTTEETLVLSSGTSQLNAPRIHLTPVPPSPGVSLVCDSPLTPQDPHFLGTFNLPSPPASSSSSSPTRIHSPLPHIVVDKVHQIHTSASSSSSSPARIHSPLPHLFVDKVHQMHTSDFDVDNLLANAHMDATGLEDGIYGQILDHIMQTEQARVSGVCNCDTTSVDRSNCGCIEDSIVYNSLLELSVRLRKAVESLGSVSGRHTKEYGPECRLYSKICELDKLTSSTLGNATSPSDHQQPTCDTYFTPVSAEFMSSTISPNCLTNIQQWESNVVRPSVSSTTGGDSLMSWDCVSRNSWANAPRP